MLQVSDLHEGFVEVVQLQDAGQQEETRDHDAGEELRQFKCLQANVSQSGGEKRGNVSYTQTAPSFVIVTSSSSALIEKSVIIIYIYKSCSFIVLSNSSHSL